MQQTARNLTDAQDGFLRGVSDLIVDRDLLDTTLNIVAFGKQHMADFDDAAHEASADVDELGLADLLAA